jgi:hypothetical protein
MYNFLNKYQKVFNIYVVIASLIAFLLFIFLVLPFEMSKSIELGLLEMPDTKFYYTSTKLYMIAESYLESGRSYYIQRRFSFDIIWPIVYGAFIFITSSYLVIKTKSNKKLVYNSLYLILYGVMFDFLENIFVSIVMAIYPVKTYGIDILAGVMTMFKWIFIYGSFIFLIIILLKYIKIQIKIKKNAL